MKYYRDKDRGGHTVVAYPEATDPPKPGAEDFSILAGYVRLWLGWVNSSAPPMQCGGVLETLQTPGRYNELTEEEVLLLCPRLVEQAKIGNYPPCRGIR